MATFEPETDRAVVDVVSAQDMEDAIALIVRLEQHAGVQHFGRFKLARVREALFRALDRYFSGHPRIETEQQAMALIRGVASDLDQAGAALDTAAAALKRAGRTTEASQTKQAALRAHHQAQQVIET
jgi:hypothetical protein